MHQRKNPQRSKGARPSPPSPAQTQGEKPSVVKFPYYRQTFLFFSLAALVSAFYNVAFDCDEVFNYWEPTHYLLYNFGFQTWEYSPAYGLRSYSYITLHEKIGALLSFFVVYKSQVFYGIKIVLGLVCALCETYFVSSIYRRFGSNIAFYTSLFLFFSPGLFISRTSYLPSSFAMYGLMLAYGSWYDGNYFLTTFASAGTAFLGWPFVLLIIFPMALDALIVCRWKVFRWSFQSTVAFVTPMLLIDYFYYKKIFFAPINIVLYNFLQQTEGGSALYGVEPPMFYYRNCFLNFNVVFLLAMVSLPVALVFRRWTGSLLKKVRGKEIALYLSPMYLWFGFMTYALEHKEERFLFVIYPLFCLAAALTLVILLSVIGTLSSAIMPRARKANFSSFVVNSALVVVLVVFIALSVSRCVGLYHNYRAPFDVYTHLEREELVFDKPLTDDINVCVGKEWYRFTSNFFIPNERVKLQFLKSGFGGLLPKPYEQENGTSIIPTHMNNFNREEPTRYINPDACHYIVDLDEEGQLEESYRASPEWETVFKSDFLFAKESRNPFFRAFWVPHLSNEYNRYSPYVLLKRKA